MNLRERCFPIYSGSFAKFFLLAAMCFLVCMNYTMLRNAKDTLVIFQPQLGIQAIPFLRTWVLIPCTFTFVKIYAFLSARYTQSKVFYVVLGLFLFYFLSFVVFLTPFDDFFRLDTLADWILHLGVPFFNPIAELLRYWTISLYYCLSEAWGPIVIFILFWGNCNRSTHLDEAKKFYSPLVFIANFSGLVASQLSLEISQSSLKFLFFSNIGKWNATLLSLTLFICLTTLIVLGLFFCLNRFVLRNEHEIKPKIDSNTKETMTLLYLMKKIGRDRKFVPLVAMIFAYFFTSGIMEIVWKYYLRQLTSNPNDFNDFLNRSTLIVSIGSMFIAFFFTGKFIKEYPWKLSAIITPVILFIPLILFIVNFVFYRDLPNFLSIASFIGAAYFCLNRICKFTFFDLSKEIAFVEFSYEEQIQTKTVLDGLVPGSARAGEALFLQVVFMTCAGLNENLPIILIVLFITHGAWVFFVCPETFKNPKLAIKKSSSANFSAVHEFEANPQVLHVQSLPTVAQERASPQLYEQLHNF